MGALRCRLNGSVLTAAYVSESALVCNSTASFGAGLVSVEVSTNGREYTASGVAFEMVSLVVRGMAPWSGPSLGGTVVTIAGSGLASGGDLLCRFGGASIGVGGLPVPQQ